MPGASWVLLDSAGAATCSAASLFIPVRWESPAQAPRSPSHDDAGSTTFSALIARWNLPLFLPAFTVLLLLAGAVVYLTSENS